MRSSREELIARPLTERQRFALEAIARGDYQVTRAVVFPWCGYVLVTTANGVSIGGQLAPLRRRDFICGNVESHTLALTVAGTFELYYDAWWVGGRRCGANCPGDQSCEHADVCMCGDDVTKHSMWCGHSPVSQHDYIRSQFD